MENFSYHVPFYIVTGGVATQGHSADITAGRVGLIDRQTWSVATAAGNGKEFFFAQGSYGGLDWNQNKVEGTHKSPYFYAKSVTNIYKSLPQRLKNEGWVIGFDGSESSRGFTWAPGKTISLKFIFSGDPIYRKFAGPKEYRVSHTVDVDCTNGDCVDECNPAATDCRPETIKLIDKINNHTELKQFGVSAKLVSDLFIAGTPDRTKYCLSLCDKGDAVALQRVQAQAPVGYTVVRTARVESISTYQFCARDVEAATLGAITTSGSSPNIQITSVAITSGGSRYRTAPTVSFTGGTGTAATATAVLTDGVVTGITINTPGAYSVAPTAAVLVGGGLPAAFVQTGAVELAVCGSCASLPGSPNLEAEKDVYIIKRPLAGTEDLSTEALRDTYADTVGTAYGVATDADKVFLGHDGSVATLQIKFAAGTVVSALLADIVEFSHTQGARCVYADPTPIAWTACGTGISSRRTLKTKLKRPECDAEGDRVDELEALLAQFPTVDLATLEVIEGVGCVDEYTVEQVSNDCLEEGCLTENVTFTYDEIPSLDDAFWEVVPSEDAPEVDRRCGIRITAGYIDPKFGNCSFDPKDYYNDEPVKFELAVFDEDASACDYNTLPTVFRSQVGTIQRQTGEWVVREVLMKTEAYLKHVAQWSEKPRMREAFDQNLLDTVDRDAFYTLYHVSFEDSYHKMDRKNEAEKFTAVFAFKENDAAALAFEAGPLAILSAKSGVSLHVNA